MTNAVVFELMQTMNERIGEHARDIDGNTRDISLIAEDMDFVRKQIQQIFDLLARQTDARGASMPPRRCTSGLRIPPACNESRRAE